MPDILKNYVNLVVDQIRWNRAKPAVGRELEAHLRDQTDALVSSGLSREAAETEAVRRMGDAVEIGAQLDRIHRPRLPKSLFALTAALLVTGVMLKLFFTYDGDAPIELWACIASAVIGAGVMLGLYFLDYTIIAKLPLLVFFGGIGLNLVFSPFLFPRVFGRTLTAGFLTLLLPLCYAALLYWLRGRRYLGLAGALAGLFLSCFSCYAVPSMTALALVFISCAVLASAAMSRNLFGIGLARSFVIFGLICAAALAFPLSQLRVDSSIVQRMSAALFPGRDPEGCGYLTIAIREAVSGAKLLGPSGQTASAALACLFSQSSRGTDYLLTYLLNRAGWLPVAAIIAVFAAFFFCAVRSCMKQKSLLGRLVSLSAVMTLLIQALVYIAANLGLPLLSPLSLPLVSYGGTATVINMALIGVMLSAFRSDSIVTDTAPVSPKKRVFLRDGELRILFK